MFKGVQFGDFSNSWVVVIFSVLDGSVEDIVV